MKNRVLLAIVLVLVVFLFVGWTNQPKDGHNVSYYTLTFDIVTVGATEVALAIECEKMILQAAAGNSNEEVHIGKTGVLTTDSGFELSAGDQVTIDSYVPATGANALYAIATAASQSLHYICFN